MCIFVSSVVGMWQLRSADRGTPVVPRTGLSTSGNKVAENGNKLLPETTTLTGAATMLPFRVTICCRFRQFFVSWCGHWTGLTRTAIGWRDFAVSGLATWNSLPVELRTSSLCIKTFAKRLQSHFFGCYMPLRTLSNWRYINLRIHSCCLFGDCLITDSTVGDARYSVAADG